LTDEEWALLEPLLPARAPRRGRPWKDHRQVVDAILFRTRVGCPWRDLPESYGPWKTAANRHRRWSADGTWSRVLSELQQGCDVGEAEWLLAVDSAVVRAHHHAAGARHKPPADVPAEVLATALDPVPVPAAPADLEVVSAPGEVTGG
jgi:transposase